MSAEQTKYYACVSSTNLPNWQKLVFLSFENNKRVIKISQCTWIFIWVQKLNLFLFLTTNPWKHLQTRSGSVAVSLVKGQIDLWHLHDACCRARRTLDSRSKIDEDRCEQLETQLKKLELIANEAETRYEEVGYRHSNNRLSLLAFDMWSQVSEDGCLATLWIFVGGGCLNEKLLNIEIFRSQEKTEMHICRVARNHRITDLWKSGCGLTLHGLVTRSCM